MVTIGVDLAEHRGTHFVVAVDAHSGWFKCRKLTLLDSSKVIAPWKAGSIGMGGR